MSPSKHSVAWLFFERPTSLIAAVSTTFFCQRSEVGDTSMQNAGRPPTSFWTSRLTVVSGGSRR